MPGLERSTVIPLLLTVPAFGLLVWWSVEGGGYAPVDWMPGAILVPAALATAVLALGARLERPSRTAGLALAALGAYVAWSFASILWADAPGDALDGSERALLYLAVFGLFALTPWTPQALRCALTAFPLLVALLGAVTLLRASDAEDPLRFLIDARLAAPLDYPNAAAALWTMGAMPALVLAARRETSPWLRPVLLAAAGLLLGLGVLTQSRGWLFTLPLVLAAALALSPGRARLVLAMLPVGLALGLAMDDLLEPSSVAGGLAPTQAGIVVRAPLDAATRALGLVTLGLLVMGAGLVAADRLVGERQAARARVRRLGPRATAAVLAVVLAGSAAGLVVVGGDPVDRVDRAWTKFKDPEELSRQERFGALGGGRYDFWRVAVNAWRDHPLLGLGQDSYAEAYVAQRRDGREEPRWTHSLPLRLLTHTGLVGALLFALFAGSVLAAFLAAARRDPLTRAAGGVALLPATVWLVHGSVDWLWEFPLLSGSALAFAGAAVALGRSSDPVSARGRRAAGIAVIVAAVLSAAVVAPTYMAGRDTNRAAAGWPSDPRGALERLDRAQRLNPLNDRSSLVEGVIAMELGRFGRARAAFAEAADRRPEGWFARFAQALVASQEHRPAEARRHLGEAHRRNPREALITEAVRRLRGRRPLSFAEARVRLQERVSQRLTRRPDR